MRQHSQKQTNNRRTALTFWTVLYGTYANLIVTTLAAAKIVCRQSRGLDIVLRQGKRL
jgi:hypothetical protein